MTFFDAITSFSIFSRLPRAGYEPSGKCSITPRNVALMSPGDELRFIGLE